MKTPTLKTILRRVMLAPLAALMLAAPAQAADVFGGTAAADLRAPAGADTAPDGSVYVADTDNDRIQKFDADGRHLATWGSEGTADGQFRRPRSLAVDSAGNVYVSDTDNQRIQKFDSSGNHLLTFGSYGEACGSTPFPSGIGVDGAGNIYVQHGGGRQTINKFSPAGVSISCFGSWGTGDGQMRYPTDIEVDAAGDVFVADTGNNRVQKFGPTGAFVAAWGTQGDGDGQFDSPFGVSLDGDGNIWVADRGNDRVQKLSPAGAFLAKFGSRGRTAGRFLMPQDVAAGAGGTVYVADTENNRVQKMSGDGAQLASFGEPAPGTLYGPTGVAAARDGVWVADAQAGSIQRFTAAGAFSRRLAAPPADAAEVFVPSAVAVDSCERNVYATSWDNDRVLRWTGDGVYLGSFGGQGGANDQLDRPGGVAVGPDGSVWVVDEGNDRIKRFSADGAFMSSFDPGDSYVRAIAVGPDGMVYAAMGEVRKFTPAGAPAAGWSSDTYLDQARGIAVDGAGNVFVSDGDGTSFFKLGPGGQEIDEIGSWGEDPGQFRSPGGVAVGSGGSVFVTDSDNSRVQRFGGLATALPAADCPVEGDGPTGDQGGDPPKADSGPQPDRAAPKGALKAAKKQRLRTVLKKGLAVTCGSNEAGGCALLATIAARDAKRLKIKSSRARTVTIAKGSAVLAKAGSKRVALKLSRATRKRLARMRSRKLTVTVAATVRDRSGNASLVTMRIALTR